MKLSRSNSKAEAESFKEVSDLGAYIRPIVEIFQCSEIPKSKWLTGKEKEFYVATVINVLHGSTNPISEEALQRYRIYFDSKSINKELKRKIADYIGRMKRKKWLKYDKWEKTVQLPPLFTNIGITEDSMKFSLNFKYEKANALEL